MKTILLIVLLLTGSVFPYEGESPSTENSTEIDLFGLIMELTGIEERSWAKPIEHVDMDRMFELMEMGLITFHEAEWYAKVDDDE
jgi:hypothetical protein